MKDSSHPDTRNGLRLSVLWFACSSSSGTGKRERLVSGRVVEGQVPTSKRGGSS